MKDVSSPTAPTLSVIHSTAETPRNQTTTPSITVMDMALTSLELLRRNQTTLSASLERLRM